MGLGIDGLCLFFLGLLNLLLVYGLFTMVNGLFLTIRWLFLTVNGLFLTVSGLFLTVNGLFLMVSGLLLDVMRLGTTVSGLSVAVRRLLMRVTIIAQLFVKLLNSSLLGGNFNDFVDNWLHFFTCISVNFKVLGKELQSSCFLVV